MLQRKEGQGPRTGNLSKICIWAERSVKLVLMISCVSAVLHRGTPIMSSQSLMVSSSKRCWTHYATLFLFTSYLWPTHWLDPAPPGRARAQKALRADVTERASPYMLATESVRSSSGCWDVRTSGFPGSCRRCSFCLLCHLPRPGLSAGFGHFFPVIGCAHGLSWSQGGGTGCSGVVRGRSGDDEGPALQLLPQPRSGLRPLAAATPARIKRALGGTAAGSWGRSEFWTPGPWTADPAPALTWPHRRPVPGPGSDRSRGAAGRWRRQWQQPQGWACGGGPSGEGGGRRLSGWRPRCEPQPRRQAHDPAGPDRVDGGEWRCAGVLRRQDCQVRRSLGQPPPRAWDGPPGDLARQISVTWLCPLSTPSIRGACLRLWRWLS